MGDGLFNFPTVRLEVQGMRHAIIHALGTSLEISKRDLELAVNQAVAEFDFGATVKRITQQEIQKQLEKTIESAVQGALYDKRSAILQLVSRGVEKLVLQDVEEHLTRGKKRR